MDPLPPTRNAGLTATAASRAADHQLGFLEERSPQSGMQHMSENIGAAEDATSSTDTGTQGAALTVKRRDFPDDEIPPVNKRTVGCTGAVGDGKALKSVSSAVSSSSAVLQAARTTASANSKILDYTPLSSLPSSGSLMRHLFELRRRQQEQRRKLDASIQSASPALATGAPLQHLPTTTAEGSPTLMAGGALQTVPRATAEAVVPRPVQPRSTAVVASAFLTSTPQTESLGSHLSSNFSSGGSSIPAASSIETLSRRPLSHLPMDRVPFDLNTNSPGENVSQVRVSQVSAKTKEIFSDENSPPDALQGDRKGNSNPSSSPYNPDLYRSPPKKGKILKHGINLHGPSQPASLSSRDRIKGSTNYSSHCINESSVGPDDRPITTSNKSFEDLILEKIKAGVYRSSPTDTPAPRKTFLRKGTGTARFEQANNSSGFKEEKVSSPAAELSHEQHYEMQPKVKFPYLKKGAGTGRFNCKSAKLKKSCAPAKRTKDKLGCEDKLTLEGPFSDHYSTPVRASSVRSKMNVMPAKSGWGGGQFSPISQYPRRELEELAAFERLEEMADNTSLSSHASTVNSLLQKGLDASTSTPTDSPCPVRNRILDNLTPRKSRPRTNPLQSVGYQTTLTARLPHPDALDDHHSLESLAHQVAGIPYNERVPKTSSQQTTAPVEKRARTVQFCERGAQILEYCVSECDTASEVPTASDASEYLNMSDLEALNQLSREGKLPGSCVSAQFVANKKHRDYILSGETHDNSFGDNSVDTAVGTPPRNRSEQPTSTLHRGGVDQPADKNQQGGTGKQAPRHTVLQFSPPRMPPDAASHRIWEAFGSRAQSGHSRPARGVVNTKQQPPANVGRAPVAGQGQHGNTERAQEFTTEVQTKQAELEAHKVLLVSKVHELEREITSFQTENAQLSKLKDTLQREKEQLARERKMFEAAVKEDRSRMEEYFEREKRKLWTEKCAMESSKQTLEHKNNTLEIINLKEEILLLKRELDRKDSMHNFTQNKLKERIKELDHQKKDFEKKTEKVISLEKENMSLKHQVDRLKLANKLKATRSVQSGPKGPQQTNEPLFNKSVRFANEHHAHNIPILDIKSKNRNSSFFASNFGGSLPDITTESLRKTAPSNGSPYDAYLSKTPFSATTGLTSADTPQPDGESVTFGNNSSLNCSESLLADGSRVTTYANGNKKQVFPSGRVVLEYCNGDWEETLPGRATVYYYSETGTRQTTHHDSGLEEVEFSDGVTEKRRPDGSVDVSFPDGSRTLRRSDGSEEVKLTDGTLVVVTAGGTEKVLHLPNGQREVHGQGFKRREYPDGTVKVLYDDGSTKTTYPGGRVRVKDKDGNLLSDSKHGLDLTPSSGHQSC